MSESLPFRWFFYSWLATTIVLLAVLPYREPPLIHEGMMALVVAIPVGVIGLILDLALPGRMRGEAIFASDSKKITYRKQYAAGRGFAYKAMAVSACGELVADKFDGQEFAYKTRGPGGSELVAGQLKISRGESSVVVYSRTLSHEWEVVFESQSRTSGYADKRELIPRGGGGYEIREYREGGISAQAVLAYTPGSWEGSLESLFNYVERKKQEIKNQQESDRNLAEKKRFGL